MCIEWREPAAFVGALIQREFGAGHLAGGVNRGISGFLRETWHRHGEQRDKGDRQYFHRSLLARDLNYSRNSVSGQPQHSRRTIGSPSRHSAAPSDGGCGEGGAFRTGGGALGAAERFGGELFSAPFASAGGGRRPVRPEKPRVGKEWVRSCRSRGAR